MIPLRVLDIYSATGGWSEAFRKRGHHIARYDNDDRFRDVSDTVIADVLTTFVGGPGDFDVVLASPPCQAFSLASVRHHFRAEITCASCGSTTYRLGGEEWQSCCGMFKPIPGTFKMTPKSEFGMLSLRLVERTLELIDIIRPRWFWIENPRATMQHFIPDDIPKTTVWYCRYGDTSAKPTHLFGRWPDTWTPRPECHNGNPDHQEAKRGAKTGTQGKKGAVARAAIPYELSLEVCLAVEEQEKRDAN